jgi:hypothetical protein
MPYTTTLKIKKIQQIIVENGLEQKYTFHEIAYMIIL